MFSYSPFKAHHLMALNVQTAQQWTLPYLTPEILSGLERLQTNTLFRDGRPILCGGVIPQRPDYGILWSFVGLGAKPDEFRIIHKFVRDFIRSLPYRRLEMHVDTSFRNGHRWARALGFTCEAYRLRAFLLNGEDASLYARINRG